MLIKTFQLEIVKFFGSYQNLIWFVYNSNQMFSCSGVELDVKVTQLGFLIRFALYRGGQ
jgi:hypothetical protein